MKYGLECEYFVKRDGKFSLCPNELPRDECGYLAECRGQPASSIQHAIWLFQGEQRDLFKRAATLGYSLELTPFTKLDPKFRATALRRFGKPSVPPERGSLYRLEYRYNDPFSRAGLHVHFSNDPPKHDESYRQMNIPKIIQTLDDAFGPEIKDAHRLSGLYEMKPYGFEYRSLPNSVGLDKLAQTLLTILRGSPDDA